MSNAGLNNWKIDVLTWPASIQCVACGYALLQDAPCDRLARTSVVTCTNASCANKGLRITLRATVVACEVAANAAP